jgi:hypothetical protein
MNAKKIQAAEAVKPGSAARRAAGGSFQGSGRAAHGQRREGRKAARDFQGERLHLRKGRRSSLSAPRHPVVSAKSSARPVAGRRVAVMSAQLHLFGAHDAQRTLGIKVHLPVTCKCGSAIGIIGPGKAMHAAEIRCSNCVAFIRWLSARALKILSAAAKSPFAPEVLALPRDEHEQS